MNSSLPALAALFALSTLSLDAEAQEIKRRRSLLITHPTTLDSLADGDFDMGLLLADAGQYSQSQLDDPGTAGDFVARAFRMANNDQGSHNEANRRGSENLVYTDKDGIDFAEMRIGIRVPDDRRMGVVFDKWASNDEIVGFGDVLQSFDSNGAFRLLAVVNRLDLAGEYDARPNNLATITPRAFGELHLVYALVDDTYYQGDNYYWDEAFPMTFELSYRVPVHSSQPDDPRLLDDPSLADDAYPTWQDLVSDTNTGTVPWKDGMELWADEWRALSSKTPGTATFNQSLEALLTKIAVPENFISMRANTRIRDDDPSTESTDESVHELREWYVLRTEPNPQMLVPRRPRREPYACLDNSGLLENMIETYWDTDDLDVTTRLVGPADKLRLYNAFEFDRLRQGYTILRDIRRDRRDDGMLKPYRNSETKLFDACSTVLGPANGTQRIQVPFQSHAKSPTVVRGVLLAPFARTQPSEPHWEMNDLPENQRHAFAVRTCSGCHSAEGASEGFHIAPRLDAGVSVLSPFLTGVVPDLQTYDELGNAYLYDELGNRKTLLRGASNGNAELYEGLGLPGL